MLVLHEANDIFLEAAKMLKYADAKQDTERMLIGGRGMGEGAVKQSAFLARRPGIPILTAPEIALLATIVMEIAATSKQ